MDEPIYSGSEQTSVEIVRGCQSLNDDQLIGQNHTGASEESASCSSLKYIYVYKTLPSLDWPEFSR